MNNINILLLNIFCLSVSDLNTKKQQKKQEKNLNDISDILLTNVNILTLLADSKHSKLHRQSIQTEI